MNKQPELTAQTRQNLLDAFWALYCEKRIEKISVKEITQKAGYNRGTFYEYFTDVYDVLECIETSLIPSIEQLPPVSTSSGSLGMPIDIFLNLYEQNSKYYSVLLGDYGDPAFAAKLKNSIKPTIMNLFTDRQDINLKEIDYILEYTLSAMIGTMSYWFKQTDTITRDNLFELISRLMENGALKQLPL